MNITRPDKTLFICDLCEIGRVWLVGNPWILEQDDHTPAGWVRCDVGADVIFLICPTCQAVARALQTVDVERSQSDAGGNPDEAKI
jgi:hypothetical protein